MLFPQGVPQTRDASGLGATSYTGRILEAQYANAVSPNVSSALGAVEASVGLWSRCLSLCQAKPAGRRELRAITPSLLALAGRELALRGRFVARIVVRGGRVRLLPSAYVDAWGGVDPSGVALHPIEHRRIAYGDCYQPASLRSNRRPILATDTRHRPRP